MTLQQVTISVCIVCFLLINPVHCVASDFLTTVQSTYTLTSTNTLNVKQDITIINNTDTRYPTAYDTRINSTNLKELKISTPTGLTIKPQQEITLDGTHVSFTFPNQVVGKGKFQTYSMTYQSPDFILGRDTSTQLVIPPLHIPDQNASISATLIFPTLRCPSPQINPPPTETTEATGITTIHFNSLKPTSSLSLRCADIRYVAVNLNYALENTNMTPIETQITLPPDTNYQQFEFASITPPPITLHTDNDGNPIATYKLEPKEQKQITVQAKGILSVIPNQVTWPNTLEHAYRSNQPFWPVGDSNYKKITASINQPFQILSYLMSETDYDRTEGNLTARHGGKQLQTDPHRFSGQDYVDAFVTLARSSGIMSRRLIGYTTSNATSYPQTVIPNKLHTWADYYDTQKNTWIQLDPTWTKTTQSDLFAPIQDMHHIVLAINGSSDTTPYPAGFYYTASNPSPEITVTDTNPFTLTPPTLSATIQTSFLSTTQLVVKNIGTTAIYQQPISIISGTEHHQSTIDRLPLGSQVIIPIKLSSTHEPIKLSIQNQTVIVGKSPFAVNSQFAIAGFMVSAAGIVTVVTRRVLVSRRRR